MNKVILVTGLQASGKSSVGPALASRLGPRSANFDGDVLYRMVTCGNVDFTPEPDPEAIRQVRLRYQGAGLLASHYARNGFDFVYSDIVLGMDVTNWMQSLSDFERHLIVLEPSIETIAEREARRGRTSYRDWIPEGGTIQDGIKIMGELLKETPRRGLWIDTSEQSINDTVLEILSNDMSSSRY